MFPVIQSLRDKHVFYSFRSFEVNEEKLEL